jgi:hypothetical protein
MLQPTTNTPVPLHVAAQSTDAADVELPQVAFGFGGPPVCAQQMKPGLPSDAQLSLLEQLIGTSSVAWQSLTELTHVNVACTATW